MAKRAGLTSSRKRRTIFTFAWIAALAVIAITLIYYEMTALLYILATLGVTALLIVVAVADLAHAQTISVDTLQSEKATGSNAGFNNRQSLKSRPTTK